MDKWNYAINFVLAHEGGYANHPSDPGGATNYGVSLRFLKAHGIDIDDNGDIDIDDIKKLTKINAKEIYKEYFWDKYKYDRINDTKIAAKVFDLSVNMGASQAHKILQRAINRLTHPGTAVDGIIGKDTLKHVHTLNPAKLYGMICECALDFYINLCLLKPHLKVFLRGWTARAKA